MKICSEPDCTGKHYARSLCEKHYQRMKKGAPVSGRSVYDLSDEERLRLKFDIADNGCWIWKYPKPGMPDRANTFLLNGRVQTAYRASYQMFRGPIPKGMLVCHTCDNGLCVNPDHLWLGTHRDNCADMFKKGREPRVQVGATHSLAKLTREDVLYIRDAHANGPRGTLAALSRRFGVNKSTIQDILRGRTWNSV